MSKQPGAAKMHFENQTKADGMNLMTTFETGFSHDRHGHST
jgi:hypothetical protein